VEFSLSVEEVKAAGDWAFERGGYRNVLHPKAGGSHMGDNGKYVTIYQRQPGGSLGMARDIWNSDNPPPG
jgi:ketosteroid isomerase-like protein